MNIENFMQTLKKEKTEHTNPVQVKQESNNIPVLAEIPITGGQLHAIASGKCMTVSQNGETMGIRFLLKNSFKLQKNNFVVNNFVMQIVALGKNNTMKREHIATQVKLQKVKSVTKNKSNNQQVTEFAKPKQG